VTAAWLALEDIHASSGPLFVYPSSHKLGLWDQAQLGLESDLPPRFTGGIDINTQYMRYHERLADAIQEEGMRRHVAQMRKGDVLIWAASLIHGGTAIVDPNRTRLSQVTHYWLQPAAHFWVPRLSPEDKHLHAKKPANWQRLADAARERLLAAVDADASRAPAAARPAAAQAQSPRGLRHRLSSMVAAVAAEFGVPVLVGRRHT
jgi:ectoine hydroxylase-related dioxygenase (phytanoyl-CoA dioxygenase family)